MVAARTKHTAARHTPAAIKTPARRIMAVSCAVLLLTAHGAVALAGPASAAFTVEPPPRQQPAPTFSLATLTDDIVHLTDLHGRVVLLNFWATWCAPCRAEMPAMQALWERYRDAGFVIVAVATSSGERAQVESFVTKLGLTYPVGIDADGKTRAEYQVSGLPTSFFIARDGRLAGRIAGVRAWDSDAARAAVETLLREP